MENDRNDQAVMIVSGDFLIGVRGAAARRRECGRSKHFPYERHAGPTTGTGLIFIATISSGAMVVLFVGVFGSRRNPNRG